MPVDAVETVEQDVPIAYSWTLRRAIADPALLAIAGFSPGAIAVTNAWFVTGRSPDLTLAVLGAIPIGNLVASTAAPVLALLSVFVLGASTLRGVRLSPTLFWSVTSLGMLAFPALATPLVASLAISSYTTSFANRASWKIEYFLERLADTRGGYLAVALTIIPGTIALIIRDAIGRKGQPSLTTTLETFGIVSIILAVAIVFLASTKERHSEIRRESRAIGILTLVGMFVVSLASAATNFTWGPREAISWHSESGAMNSIGRLVSVDDTGVQILDEGGILSFIDGNSITRRSVCPQPIDANLASSAVELLGRLLDTADYDAYASPPCL
ncbi:hypothetical protein [Myceligenerans salitolerans]|uniref:Uncharacterized protein n=1 Tax=Myceligenerans salitolerans TaxID=1230528 RepID=A0ABS3IA93_9MICO|nr:hypothetical protein [Myceligenerans salitolerans]MBO0609879.1 hypothetical protein [Myceligenerans salitolerans]